MFDTCCQETIAKTEEYYLYKGFNNQKPKRVPIRESQINPNVENTLEPFRLYARSKQEEAMNFSNEKREMFVDKEFPPEASSLGQYSGRALQWIRLSKLYSNFNEAEYKPMDLLSMKDGDSYFLAALLALSQNYVVSNDIFDQQLQVSRLGAYKLKVSIHGKPQQLIIDDFLPVFASNNQRAVFSQIDPNMIWVALLEKAYAKINKSYENINSGYAHEVFVTFSLAPCIYQVIPTDFRHEEQNKCWNTLQEAIQQRFPTVVGSRKKFTSPEILHNQTYCLKSCKQIEKKTYTERRVILWELPGQKPQQIASYLEYQQNGYAISLPLVEFMRNFEVIDVSHHRKNFNSHFYQLKCGPTNSVIYSFENLEKTDTYFTLQRESGDKGRLRLILIQIGHGTLYEFKGGDKEEVYSDVTLRINLLPIGRFYLICESASLSSCILRVYTLANLPLKKFTGSKIQLLQQAFLQQCIDDKASHQQMSKQHEDWYSSQALFHNLGLGYFALNLDPNSKIGCEITINKVQLNQEGLNLMNKTFKENFFKTLSKGHREILIFEFIGKTFQAFSFPPNCMNIRMII